jgi:hypothetical protein
LASARGGQLRDSRGFTSDLQRGCAVRRSRCKAQKEG